MNLIVCSVRDSAVNAFMQPFFVHAVGMAVRSFGDEVRKDGTGLNAHPEDYALYELGVFDDSNGSVTMLPEPRQLARGVDYVEVKHESVKASSGS